MCIYNYSYNSNCIGVYVHGMHAYTYACIEDYALNYE